MTRSKRIPELFHLSAPCRMGLNYADGLFKVQNENCAHTPAAPYTYLAASDCADHVL